VLIAVGVAHWRSGDGLVRWWLQVMPRWWPGYGWTARSIGTRSYTLMLRGLAAWLVLCGALLIGSTFWM
jgi:hypothetical protein